MRRGDQPRGRQAALRLRQDGPWLTGRLKRDLEPAELPQVSRSATSGTRPRRCSSRRASRGVSPWRSSGTRRSRRRWKSTRTSPTRRSETQWPASMPGGLEKERRDDGRKGVSPAVHGRSRFDVPPAEEIEIANGVRVAADEAWIYVRAANNDVVASSRGRTCTAPSGPRGPPRGPPGRAAIAKNRRRALVAQGIEQRIPNPCAQVRILAGAPLIARSGAAACRRTAGSPSCAPADWWSRARSTYWGVAHGGGG